jgi:hypothetical protein
MKYSNLEEFFSADEKKELFFYDIYENFHHLWKLKKLN